MDYINRPYSSQFLSTGTQTPDRESCYGCIEGVLGGIRDIFSYRRPFTGEPPIDPNYSLQQFEINNTVEVIQNLPVDRPSPLEQFEVVKLINLSFLSPTTSALSIAIVLGIVIYFKKQATSKTKLIPGYSQNFAEIFFRFIANLIKEQIGNAGKPYFPILYTIFLVIISINLFGMIPYGFTATSHLVITFGLSVPVFFAITIIGFSIHKINFISFLFPPGAPLILAPLLVVLELVSYCFRAISLGVRLFANMMAGHTLVVILAGFGATMYGAGGVLSFLSFLPVLIVFALTGLEAGVACLQAYVFVILSSIYLNDAIELHH